MLAIVLLLLMIGAGIALPLGLILRTYDLSFFDDALRAAERLIRGD